MNEVFRLTLSDKIAKAGLIISSIFLALQIIAILIFYFSLPPFIPVFNQLPWGEKRLGIKPVLFLPIIVTILFASINYFLFNMLYDKSPLLSRILSITTLLVSLLSFIFTIRTIHLFI